MSGVVLYWGLLLWDVTEMAKLNTKVIEEKQQSKRGCKAQAWALHQGLGDILSLLT